MRNAIKLAGIALVTLLAVTPLGFPRYASSESPLQWDERGRLILPEGQRKMTDQEYMEWYCNKYPDKCMEEETQTSSSEEDYAPGGGGQ